MDVNSALSVLNNPIRRQILLWLKERSNFPPPLPEHVSINGVCVGYIQEKAGLSQSTISNYMSQLKKQELVIAERQGQWTFYRRNEDVIKLFVKRFAEEMGE